MDYIIVLPVFRSEEVLEHHLHLLQQPGELDLIGQHLGTIDVKGLVFLEHLVQISILSPSWSNVANMFSARPWCIHSVWNGEGSREKTRHMKYKLKGSDMM